MAIIRKPCYVLVGGWDWEGYNILNVFLDKDFADTECERVKAEELKRDFGHYHYVDVYEQDMLIDDSN